MKRPPNGKSRTLVRRHITLTARGNRNLNELMTRTNARSASHAVEEAINAYYDEVVRKGEA